MYIKFQFLGSGALYLKLETCDEGINWHVYSIKGLKEILILSCLNDFMTCSGRFNIQSEGSISQLCNKVER